MRRLLALLAGISLSAATLAADVSATLTVTRDGAVVFEQTNKFVGMTDKEAAELQKSGMRTLNFASQHQDKGGPYTIVWKWNSDPAIETQGMKFQAVNSVLRMGTKWLDDEVTKSEGKRKQGKDRPWGK